MSEIEIWEEGNEWIAKLKEKAKCWHCNKEIQEGERVWICISDRGKVVFNCTKCTYPASIDSRVELPLAFRSYQMKLSGFPRKWKGASLCVVSYERAE